MKLPFVSRSLYELACSAAEKAVAKLEAEVAELKAELVKEREAARNAISSAMVASRLGDPYRPRHDAPVAKPIQRETAIKVLRRLEAEERELLAQKDKNGPADTAGPAAN